MPDAVSERFLRSNTKFPRIVNSPSDAVSTSSKIVSPDGIVTSSPACGTLPPQVSGSDHKSAPVIDDELDAVEDKEELDTLEELDESDELEDVNEELATTRELTWDELLDTSEELVCIDELVETIELLDDELTWDCKLDWDDEVAINEELELEEERTCKDELDNLDDWLEPDSPAPPHAASIKMQTNNIPCFKTPPYNDRKKVMEYIV